MNFKISNQDEIFYFGDIDFEGINIFITLQEKYENNLILPYIKGYQKMLELEQEPKNIKTNQNIKKQSIEKFLKFFNEKEQEKLKNIFKNKKYIPQEIINYTEAKKIVNEM